MQADDTETDSSVSRRNYLGLSGGALAALSFAGIGSANEGNPGRGRGRGQGPGHGNGLESGRLLIENGTIVTVDEEHGVLENASLLVEDGRIEEIGHDIDAPGAETIDASDSIVFPGFVNSHHHTWQAGVRGVAGDWSFMEYLETMLGEISSHYTPNDVYLGNLFGALEQLNAGTTTVMDWFHVANSPGHTNRAIDGLKDAGIRAVFAHGTPGDDNETWWDESTEPHPDDIRRVHDERFADATRTTCSRSRWGFAAPTTRAMRSSPTTSNSRANSTSGPRCTSARSAPAASKHSRNSISSATI